MVVALTALVAATHPAFACIGDCNGDGEVTVDELIVGVNIALGVANIDACPAFDRNGDGAVTIDEILAAVNALLIGCPATPAPDATATFTGTTTASPSPTATMPPTSTVTATATETATPTPNQPPVLPTFGVYRAYAGNQVQFPIAATDPEGGALTYMADTLPDGAQLDAVSGVFSWLPTAAQLGPFYVPFSVSDTGMPPLSAQGQLVFDVTNPIACRMVSCDPATGCQSTLPAPQTSCCSGVTLPRVAEPVSDCPGARVVFAGRNFIGFGKLQDCDQMHLFNSAQTSAQLRLNIEARCMRTDDAPVTVHAHLESSSALHMLVVDDDATVDMQPGPDGYAQRLQQAVIWPVRGGGPYFDLEGAEANLTITITDFDGVQASDSIRVILTFATLPDLPETP